MQKPHDRLPPLDLLLGFEAAARQLSFTRAAEERFLTQSAISRQIRALEDDLGVALFQRGHRSLTLTREGERLLIGCQAALAQLRQTVGAIRAPAAREVLSLSTTPSFAALWLIPRLRSFTDAHPGIDVRLDASYALRDLRADGFDLAVRYLQALPSLGEPLFRERMLPVCAPGLCRPPEPPLRAAGDLARHTLLQMAPMAGGGLPLEWEAWLQGQGVGALQPRSVLTFSSYNEVIAAALAGQGVALGRRPLIDKLLAKGRLVAPFGDGQSTEKAYFVVVEPGARQRPAVRALEAWLVTQARQSVADAPAVSLTSPASPAPRPRARRAARPSR